jgi:hypothetical protein
VRLKVLLNLHRPVALSVEAVEEAAAPVEVTVAAVADVVWAVAVAVVEERLLEHLLLFVSSVVFKVFH